MSIGEPVAGLGVGYAALTLTTFNILEGPRGKLVDFAYRNLRPRTAEKVDDLANCPYCASFWVSLVAAKGRPLKALRLSGIASVLVALVLISFSDD